jgi:dihydrofolate reductase
METEEQSHTPSVVIVVAQSRIRRALGNKNRLLWHIPQDLKRFKEKTLGHPIIMGRKTFESIVTILGKPLPGRQNIVVTRNPDFTYEGVIVASSLEDALAQAQALHPTEIHIGGGAELYTQALPFVDKLFVTFVDDEPEADTFFPEFEHDFVITKEHVAQEHNGLKYQWVDYVRR